MCGPEFDTHTKGRQYFEKNCLKHSVNFLSECVLLETERSNYVMILQKCFFLIHMVCPFEARTKVEVEVLTPVECEAWRRVVWCTSLLLLVRRHTFLFSGCKSCHNTERETSKDGSFHGLILQNVSKRSCAPPVSQSHRPPTACDSQFAAEVVLYFGPVDLTDVWTGFH